MIETYRIRLGTSWSITKLHHLFTTTNLGFLSLRGSQGKNFWNIRNSLPFPNKSSWMKDGVSNQFVSKVRFFFKYFLDTVWSTWNAWNIWEYLYLTSTSQCANWARAIKMDSNSSRNHTILGVKQGSFSQSDQRFLPTAGIQCACISLYSVCYNTMKQISR